jgi:hypothetical protein
MKRTTAILLSLAFALGLVSLLAWITPATAQPVEIASLPPVTQTDGRAGACYSFYYDPPEGPDRPFIPLAVNAGARWDRFDFAWPRLEPANGVWSDTVRSAYDVLVSDLRSAGIQNIIGILLWTPDWAATSRVQGLEAPSFGQRPFGWYAPLTRTLLFPQAINAASSPPQGLYEEWNDWTTADGDPINYWGRFVYQVVDRYSDQGVKHWEMWNEAEWDYFWTGSDADYARLLKVGYQATKAACPDCTVLFAGLHYWADPTFFERVLDIVNNDPDAPANNTFFDVMSLHLYSRSSNAYDVVNSIRSRMSAYVPNHPLWLTETGVPVWGDPLTYNPKYDYAATQDEAAAYLIQSYANAWASGVERYFFFRTNDADMGEYFGLIRNDRSLRPAYVAYQVAATYLISPSFASRVSTGDSVRVTLWGTPRGKVSVLWNTGPNASVYTLTATLPTATLVDRFGVTQTVPAAAGAYTFTLPGATANLISNPNDYIIGGDPLIAIESEATNQPPTSTVQPLPAVTVTPAFAVAWEGQDNESGVWLYDVQVRDGGGEWASWKHSTADTSGAFTGTHGHTYYFRVRATDRVGNRADWPAASQAQTTLDLSSTFHFAAAALFADEDYDDAWDTPIATTGEITLTGVALHFHDAAGTDVVTPTVADSWEFTTTVIAGQTYRLQAALTITSTGMLTDYLRTLTFTWPRGREVYSETHSALGLWRVRRVYMPLVLRQ